MQNFVEAAHDSIMRPDVQSAMQTLAKYGLGVNIPHMHDAEGHFAPLSDGVISFEQGRKVSFHNEGELPLGDSIAVAWRIDPTSGQVQITGKCRHGGSGCVDESD